VVRALHEKGNLKHAYCTETRPYNQGARLTAYELVHEKMPATLVCDDMVTLLMEKKSISAVVVGKRIAGRSGAVPVNVYWSSPAIYSEAWLTRTAGDHQKVWVIKSLSYEFKVVKKEKTTLV